MSRDICICLYGGEKAKAFWERNFSGPEESEKLTCGLLSSTTCLAVAVALMMNEWRTKKHQTWHRVVRSQSQLGHSLSPCALALESGPLLLSSPSHPTPHSSPCLSRWPLVAPTQTQQQGTMEYERIHQKAQVCTLLGKVATNASIPFVLSLLPSSSSEMPLLPCCHFFPSVLRSLRIFSCVLVMYPVGCSDSFSGYFPEI